MHGRHATVLGLRRLTPEEAALAIEVIFQFSAAEPDY